MSTERYLREALFIIGAGAHVPYEMPTSNDLTRIIKALYKAKPPNDIGVTRDNNPFLPLNQKHELYSIANRLKIVAKAKNPGFSIKGGTSFDPLDEETKVHFDAFLEEFCESHVTSIDAYLANLHKEQDNFKRNVYGKFGKLLIAYLIARFEAKTPLGSREHDWMHFFINEYLRKDPEVFFNDPPKFITFNYDRLLERMIFTHLTGHHKINSEKAIEMIECLNILHVYGTLGSYTQWPPEFSNDISFFEKAIGNIQVIGDERNSERKTAIIENITLKVEKTSLTYFLGYGFDETNNKLLNQGFSTSNWIENHRLKISSTIKVSPRDRVRAYETMKSRAMFRTDTERKIIEYSCLDLLTHVAPLKL